MENEVPYTVVEAQRMEKGVIISFENGDSAIFSAALLYSMLPLAELVCDSEFPEENPET